MEGESSYNNPERLLPSDFRGILNDVSYIAGNDQRMFFPTNNSESHNLAWSLPPCFGCPKTPVSYYEFLAENSTFLETGSPSDALRGISPVGPIPDVKGVSDCQRELLSNSLWNPSGFKTSDCSCDMDAYALKPDVHMLNCDIAEASVNVGCSIPHNEGEPESNRLSSQHEIQTHSSRMHHLSKDIGNLPQVHPSVTAAPSAYISNPSKYKAFKRDRERRIRIAEGLRALKGLLPHPVEGGQAAVLNNIIDYIKYLQCQMKELTQSRLGGVPTSAALFSLEGYGHYLVQEQMTKESLENMVGKLLELNPSAASNLLLTKGLVLMPTASAATLHDCPHLH